MSSPHKARIAAMLIAWATVSLLSEACRAEVAPVATSAPEPGAWVGQRAPFFVELRAGGPFAGAASFSLPEVPRCVIVKVGAPVVSSKELEGETWFVQTHEFALFSQADGSIEVPSFEVRFSNRKGFDGPEQDHVEQTEPLRFEIKRPPGGQGAGFVVTTDDMEITETWDPPPGPAQQGAIFHRTITQEADQMTGMALPPPPTSASDGVRVRLAKPDVADQTERGALRGARTDTLTYELQEPGTLTVPAIKYVWWNPDSEEFASKTLPAVTFYVAAASTSDLPARTTPVRIRWAVWGLGAAVLGVFVMFGRRRLARWARQTQRSLNPPDRVAARKLVRACRRNDAAAAERAWLEWRTIQPSQALVPPQLSDAMRELHRHLYGPTPDAAWRGDRLRSAFRQHVASQSSRRRKPVLSLPALNP